MAKAPKAPGTNGPGTAQGALDELTARLAAVGRDGDAYARAPAAAAEPAAWLVGEGPARALLPWAARAFHADAMALGHLAAGLARRGERAAAEAARAEAVAAVNDRGVDGEEGAVAWCAVARASAALGDEPGVDRALDAAEACARREREDPATAASTFALALAEHRRLARLTALLAATPPREIAAGVERAATDAVALATAAGDVAAFRRLHALLERSHGQALHDGVVRGGEESLRAGRAAPLRELLTGFAGSAHGAEAAARLALAAADLGDAAGARAMLADVVARGAPPSSLLVKVLEVLGEDDAAEAQRERVEPSERRFLPLRDLGRALRVGKALGRPGVGGAYLARANAAGRRGGWLPLAEVGIALASAGERDATFYVLQAVTNTHQASKGARSHECDQAILAIGLRAAEEGAWEPAILALQRCAAKRLKWRLAARIACLYARAGDPAGASKALSYIPADERVGVMAACDALHALAGLAPPWADWT